MEGFVRDTVRRFIAHRPHEGRADIVAALTYELPALVVFQVLGVPRDGRRGGQGRARPTGCCSCSAAPARTSRSRSRPGMADVLALLRGAGRGPPGRRPATTSPPTSCTPPTSGGHPLTQQEVSTILFGLLLAGHETTTNLLGNALRRLLEHRRELGGALRRPDARSPARSRRCCATTPR